MSIYLTIKGQDPERVMENITKRGIDEKDVADLRMLNDNQSFVCKVPDGYREEVEQWYAEVVGAPPLPAGTLLFWQHRSPGQHNGS